MTRKRVLFVFGTRPEAIKMASVVKIFQQHGKVLETRVCVTAQHRHMLDQVLHFFDIIPDYDLDLMTPNQDLYTISANVMVRFKAVLDDFKPEYVFVHGDTTTSTFSAIAAFYAQVKVAHVEAGLRTRNLYSPFPEELNRQVTSRIASLHFAPTQQAKENLLMEGVDTNSIHVTGNTVIDSLFIGLRKLEYYEDEELLHVKNLIDPAKRMILVTGHRRENFGEPFLNICRAIHRIAEREDVQVIYPVHLNPNVQRPVRQILSGNSNVHLIEPVAYPSFLWLMQQSALILTDSGGVQEEAPSLGKQVLVMRNTTERPEAVEAGTAKLVGTDADIIHCSVTEILNNEGKEIAIANPYGDGKAAERILEVILANSCE